MGKEEKEKKKTPGQGPRKAHLCLKYGDQSNLPAKRLKGGKVNNCNC